MFFVLITAFFIVQATEKVTFSLKYIPSAVLLNEEEASKIKKEYVAPEVPDVNQSKKRTFFSQSFIPANADSTKIKSVEKESLLVENLTDKEAMLNFAKNNKIKFTKQLFLKGKLFTITYNNKKVDSDFKKKLKNNILKKGIKPYTPSTITNN